MAIAAAAELKLLEAWEITEVTGGCGKRQYLHCHALLRTKGKAGLALTVSGNSLELHQTQSKLPLNCTISASIQTELLYCPMS